MTAVAATVSTVQEWVVLAERVICQNRSHTVSDHTNLEWQKYWEVNIYLFYWTYYRPQRSCGQGNVFTGVCLSTGGGVCLSACWDARPPPGTRQTPHPSTPGTRQTHPPLDQPDTPRTRQTPPPQDQADPTPPPQDQADPPGKQTPAYGLRAAGTHPTGMHSCFKTVKMAQLVTLLWT